MEAQFLGRRRGDRGDQWSPYIEVHQSNRAQCLQPDDLCFHVIAGRVRMRGKTEDDVFRPDDRVDGSLALGYHVKDQVAASESPAEWTRYTLGFGALDRPGDHVARSEERRV